MKHKPKSSIDYFPFAEAGKLSTQKNSCFTYIYLRTRVFYLLKAKRIKKLFSSVIKNSSSKTTTMYCLLLAPHVLSNYARLKSLRLSTRARLQSSNRSIKLKSRRPWSTRLLSISKQMKFAAPRNYPRMSSPLKRVRTQKRTNKQLISQCRLLNSSLCNVRFKIYWNYSQTVTKWARLKLTNNSTSLQLRFWLLSTNFCRLYCNTPSANLQTIRLR